MSPASLLLVLALSGLSPAPHGLVTPAEFERQSSVWMAWPPEPACIPGHPIAPPALAVLVALVPHVSVDLVVRTPAEIVTVFAEMRRAGVPRDRVRMHVVPDAGFWLRDIGPHFVRTPAGPLGVVDFGFNGWGYPGNIMPPAASRAMEALDRTIAERLGLASRQTDLTGEGGGREFNGRGTLLLVSEVERDRNPGWSTARIEAEYRRTTGANHIIWLPRGLVEDRHIFEGPLPGGAFPCVPPGGHIDEMARFADPSTILVEDPSATDRARDGVAREDGRRTDEVRRILAKSLDQDGKPFRVLSLPAADHVDEPFVVDDLFASIHFQDGTKLVKGQTIRILPARSYLNFFITNGAVLAPRYGGPKDALAKAVYARAFPGREIVMIDADALNHCGGGIHCMVHEQPAP